MSAETVMNSAAAALNSFVRFTDMKKKGRAYGLSEEFIETVFNAIHEESVRAQNEILES